MTTLPPARRRLLAAALRQFRTQGGYSLGDAAVALKCDRSKISRMETGLRGIRPAELGKLLTAYGVDEAQQRTLLTLAWTVQDANRWRCYRYGADPYQDLIGLVAGTTVWTYEAQFIPTLLQTEDYVRAIAATALSTSGDDVREQFVRHRLARQQILVRDGGPPGFSGILSEAALRQLIGRPAVMRAQLHHLVEVSRAQPGVTLQVLPFTAGAHATRSGPFAIMGFSEPGHLAVVCLAGQTEGVYLDDEDDVARYSLIFQHLRAAALSPAESARLIQDVARDW